METKSKAKLILFGEWAVLKGSECVGLTLEAEFSLTPTPSKLTNLISQKATLTNDEWFMSCLKAIKNKFQTDENFSFKSSCDWTYTEGLGTSSALFLSLYKHYSHRSNKKNIKWDEVISTFFDIESNNGSGADLAIQFMNKPCIYKKPEAPHPLTNFAWPKEVHLIHGPGKLKSNQMIKKINPDDRFCTKIKESTHDFIEKRDWEKAITEHRLELDKIGVIDPRMKVFESKLKQRSQKAAIKSLGAGGLDALLVWSPDASAVDKCLDEFKFEGWYKSPYKPICQ